jgi:hypothetical protein
MFVGLSSFKHTRGKGAKGRGGMISWVRGSGFPGFRGFHGFRGLNGFRGLGCTGVFRCRGQGEPGEGAGELQAMISRSNRHWQW